jgi:hypothetical protein
MYQPEGRSGHLGAPALLTFAADGTLLQSAFESPGISTAQGSWMATGDKTATFTFVSIRTSREEGANGPFPFIELFQGVINLSDGGDAWTGELKRVAMWTLTGWKPLQVPIVSIRATRISAGAEWPVGATPVLGTPPTD